MEEVGMTTSRYNENSVNTLNEAKLRVRKINFVIVQIDEVNMLKEIRKTRFTRKQIKQCSDKLVSYIDGTPCEVKVSRTVWRRGKDGDNIKVLPIPIIIPEGFI